MKKKTVIFGVGYHGRAAFRKSINIKSINIICWVDANQNLKNSSLFGKKIYTLDYLKKIDFDQIIFCGRHIKDQLKSYNKFKLNKNILIWDSFKLKPHKDQILKRDLELYKILKSVIKKLEDNKISYWADTSGLLSLIRKESISVLSDFDIGIDCKHMRKIFDIFKFEKKYKIYRGHFIRNKSFSKIAFISKNKSISFEPAVLDFTFYDKIKKTYYKYGNERIKVPLKLFKSTINFKYKDLNIKIPHKSKEYLIHLYGSQFMKKSRFYKNLLSYKKFKIQESI